MLFDRHHFHFFGNKEITSLYVTLALIHFGEGLISIFVPIYFWELGFPLWKILFFYFLKSLYFIIWALLFLPVMRKLSDKMMMFLGIPLTILYFLGLGFITARPIFFYLAPALAAASMVFFNVGYHLKFSGAVDGDHIGREVGMRYMTGSLVKLAAPFLGGVLITIVNFQNTFIAGSVVLLFAAIPLFFFPERNVSSRLRAGTVMEFIKDRTLRPFTLSGFGFATEKMIEVIIWPIFIFLSIGSIQNFGGLVSIGLLAGAIITYLVGFLSDVGRRRRVIKWTTGLLSLIWIIRPFLLRPLMVAGSHVGGQIARAALMVAWSSQY